MKLQNLLPPRIEDVAPALGEAIRWYVGRVPETKCRDLERPRRAALPTGKMLEIRREKVLRRGISIEQVADHYARVVHSKTILPLPVLGRNERCPCGSGRKFKKCCMVALEKTGG